MSLLHKQNSENPRDSAWKALLQMAHVFSSVPSRSAPYWRSRIAKALVWVWDRTVWHSSHTTWVTHWIIQQHVLTIEHNRSNDLIVGDGRETPFKAHWRWINRPYFKERRNVWNMDVEFDNKINASNTVKAEERRRTSNVLFYPKPLSSVCVCVCLCCPYILIKKVIWLRPFHKEVYLLCSVSYCKT